MYVADKSCYECRLLPFVGVEVRPAEPQKLLMFLEMQATSFFAPTLKQFWGDVPKKFPSS